MYIIYEAGFCEFLCMYSLKVFYYRPKKPDIYVFSICVNDNFDTSKRI